MMRLCIGGEEMMVAKFDESLVDLKIIAEAK